jgi:hypothetical protein
MWLPLPAIDQQEQGAISERELDTSIVSKVSRSLATNTHQNHTNSATKNTHPAEIVGRVRVSQTLASWRLIQLRNEARIIFL